MALRSQAAPAIDGKLLGVSESDLLLAFDSAQKLRKPSLGPHGLRGLWVLLDTQISGLPFVTTFYMRDKLVQRIEQYWATTERLCANRPSLSNLLLDMKEKYGTGLSSSDFGEGDTQLQSTVWEAGTVDVLMHQSLSPSQCSIRVIYKEHETKDASEL